MLNDEQMLFLAMCLVSVKDDLTLKGIRERFMKRDRQWDEADAHAEYRYKHAEAIVDRWRTAAGRR